MNFLLGNWVGFLLFWIKLSNGLHEWPLSLSFSVGLRFRAFPSWPFFSIILV
ncbi:hypothetical protein V6Z11_A06G105800 [Gossypium hirsutum]